MNTDLPIPLDQLDPFRGESDEAAIRPFLDVDQGTAEGSTPGTFNYSGTVLKRTRMVFIAHHTFRNFYSHSYREKSDAEVVCASWDGRIAFGTAERGPLNVEHLQERNCDECRQAKIFECKPSGRYLVAIKGELQDGSKQSAWMPAIFTASGIRATPTRKAWESVQLRALSQRVKKGDQEVPAPCYFFEVDVDVHKPNPHRVGYAPRFAAPKALPKEDVMEIYQTIVSPEGGVGLQMWRDDMASLEARARSIGADDPEKINEDDMPF